VCLKLRKAERISVMTPKATISHAEQHQADLFPAEQWQIAGSYAHRRVASLAHLRRDKRPKSVRCVSGVIGHGGVEELPNSRIIVTYRSIGTVSRIGPRLSRLPERRIRESIPTAPIVVSFPRVNSELRSSRISFMEADLGQPAGSTAGCRQCNRLPRFITLYTPVLIRWAERLGVRSSDQSDLIPGCVSHALASAAILHLYPRPQLPRLGFTLCS